MIIWRWVSIVSEQVRKKRAIDDDDDDDDDVCMYVCMYVCIWEGLGLLRVTAVVSSFTCIIVSWYHHSSIMLRRLRR